MTGLLEQTAITARDNPYLIGHEEAERTLLEAFNAGKLPHAWLISGARGIGKATLAYRFARFLLNQEGHGGLFGAPDTLAMDASHPLLRRVAQGSHPDLLVLETKVDEKTGKAARDIVVDDARKIAGFLNLTPAESDYRVVIVDSVDEMNRNAANSILKLLEEPPANAILVLVSHAPGRLLPTIRSRCRHLKMNPLGSEGFLQVLRQVSPEIKPKEAKALSLLAEGSPGFAVELHAHKGLALYGEMLSLLQGFPSFDVAALYKLGDKLAAKTDAVSWRHSTYMLMFFLSRLIKAHAGGFAGEEVLEGEGALVQKLATAKPLSHWLDIWQQAGQLIADTDRVNLDRKVMTVNVFSMMK